MTSDTSDEMTELNLPGSFRLDDAPARRESLLARLAELEGDPRPVRLEIDADRPSAPALQLLAACRRSLDASSRFGGYGPRATAALGAPAAEGSE